MVMTLAMFYALRRRYGSKGKNSLSEGEKVEFEVTEGPKGPRAANVKPISE